MFTAFFERLSRKRIIRSLKKASLVGCRECSGRKIHVYLMENYFVQVLFKGDDPAQEVEQIEKFSDLTKLNSYLEKEFRATF